jgi:hypothetical protein
MPIGLLAETKDGDGSPGLVGQAVVVLRDWQHCAFKLCWFHIGHNSQACDTPIKTGNKNCGSCDCCSKKTILFPLDSCVREDRAKQATLLMIQGLQGMLHVIILVASFHLCT